MLKLSLCMMVLVCVSCGGRIESEATTSEDAQTVVEASIDDASSNVLSDSAADVAPDGGTCPRPGQTCVDDDRIFCIAPGEYIECIDLAFHVRPCAKYPKAGICDVDSGCFGPVCN